MNNRLAKTLLAAAAIAAFAGPVAAQASQGADDPAGHVRQESRQSAAAPTSTTAKQSAASKSRSRHARHHGRRHARRADDNSAQRQVRGTDDGPNHS
jgi:hypothetical protein